jgi:hypothetical protein
MDLTGSGLTSWPFVFSTTSHDRRCTAIYPSALLQSLHQCDHGTISSVSYFITNPPVLPLTDLTIRMRLTTASSYLPPYSFDNSNWAVVYEATTTISAGGWFPFSLTTPFEWSAGSNLEVDISFDNSASGGSTGNGTAQAFNSSPTGTVCIYSQANSTYGDPKTWTSGPPTVSPSTRYPRIMLEMGSPIPGACCTPYNQCVQATYEDCANLYGGIFGGPYSSCTPGLCGSTGACCRPDRTCLVLGEAACQTTGGLYHGDGSDCSPSPCAALTSSEIIAWGDSSYQYGQLDVPDPNLDFVAVAAGGLHGLGLKSDGSVVTWGRNESGQGDVPAPNTDFVAISAAWDHSMGLKTDGSIVLWGDNTYGQNTPPSPNTDFVAIADGGGYCLGLKSDGSIVAWGTNYWGETAVPQPNSGFVAISAGYEHALGLKTDGTIVAWGYNYFGQCNVPPAMNFVSIAAGLWHSMGVQIDGTIVAWGRNSQGQCNVPIPNADFMAIDAHEYSMGLKNDGSIVEWGEDATVPVPEPNSDFLAISTNGPFSLALRLPRGACCISTYCEQLTQADCLAMGGSSWTWNMPCTPNPCVTRGACCLTDGTCEEYEWSECTLLDGMYLGHNSICSQVQCSPAGACCFDNETCQQLTEMACMRANGRAWHFDTPCSSGLCFILGACCFSDGTCVEERAIQCFSGGGTYLGDGSTCSPGLCPHYGACCMDDGTCVVMNATECPAGRYWGDGTTCDPNPCPQPGACCLSDGSCRIEFEYVCTVAGINGIWQGPNTTCEPDTCPAPMGACCLPGDVCQHISQADCQALGGIGWSPGQACGPDTCPFCTPSQISKFMDPDGVGIGHLGSAIAVQGDVAVIGAPDAGSWPYAGRAYVLMREGGQWVKKAELSADSTYDVRSFGIAVAIDGNTIMIGADLTFGAGTAYVFVGAGEDWQQQAEITSPALGSSGHFGMAVAVQGNTAVIGAPAYNAGGVDYAGAAWVFTRSGTTWTQEAELSPAAGPQSWELFGASIALDDDTALIGARLSDPWQSGAAYVFVRSGGVWTQEQRLTSPGTEFFGVSVALEGNTALIGAPGYDTSGSYDAGAAYLFVRSGGIWTREAEFTAADAVYVDYFGHSVALRDDTVIIGAFADEQAGGPVDTGAAYLFTRSGGTWRQRTKITATDAAASAYFGAAVALAEHTAIVGASQATQPGSGYRGAAYFFDLGCPAACCLSDGSCLAATPTECATAGGIYQGNASDCVTTSCPQPQGACCLPAPGGCRYVPQADCGTLGGTYMGNATTCPTTPPCPGTGDANGDAATNGLDMDCFVICLTGTAPPACNCGVADMNGDGVLDDDDIQLFVCLLLGLAPADCP